MTIQLDVVNFHWVKGDKDDPEDHCAHGDVRFQINGTEFANPRNGGWTVSASMLYLLRTLEDNHNIENSVTQGNQLFPCCGFSVWPTKEGKYRVHCLGCPNGIDVYVTRQSDKVLIESLDGKSETVLFEEWVTAVFGFVDQVLNFYKNSSPKTPHQESFDTEGWNEFWKEVELRRSKSYV